MRNLREEDFIGDGVTKDDLTMLRFPSDEDMHSQKIKGTFYGFYHKWNARKHLEVVKDLGWKGLLKSQQEHMLIMKILI